MEMRGGSQGIPKAIVFACDGGSQGDLGVVRSLGRSGVEVIVIAEYEGSAASTSKYCVRSHVVREFKRYGEEAIEKVLAVAAGERCPPVLFPTADPDLRMLSDYRSRLSPHVRMFLSEQSVIDTCLDKDRFSLYAGRFDVPVPRTATPHSLDEALSLAADLTYPVIMKPARPDSWKDPRVREIVSRKKAVVAESAQQLREWYTRVAPFGRDVVLQEYIKGRDDRLYSLHVYVASSGEPLGVYTGQKVRTFPAYAGIGCFVRSVYVPEIVETGLALLKGMDYRGMALLQFKRDDADGVYKLLEINPRVSSWNILASASGVNLPYLAFCDTAGLPVEKLGRQTEGLRYLYFEHDLHAFREYQRCGDWNWLTWGRSLLGPNVYELFARDDPRPFVVSLSRKVKGRMGRVASRVQRLAGGALRRESGVER